MCNPSVLQVCNGGMYGELGRPDVTLETIRCLRGTLGREKFGLEFPLLIRTERIPNERNKKQKKKKERKKCHDILSHLLITFTTKLNNQLEVRARNHICPWFFSHLLSLISNMRKGIWNSSLLKLISVSLGPKPTPFFSNSITLFFFYVTTLFIGTSRLRLTKF